MSDLPSKAVFLSYASQDVAAAQRIADALRAAGVEVWFDQSELRGGDAWDAKLRRQIKECALFVPIVTPNTNARAEGYFRLEWKLAVDRSHLMADDAPFLFPIVVGDVADATARVPDKFREVQWTRLRLDETPAELGARVAKLLSGEGAVVRGQRSEDSAGRSKSKAPPSWLRHAWVGVGLLFAVVYAIKPLWQTSRRPEPAPAAVAPATPPAPAAQLSEARRLTARAQAMTMDKYDSTADDYATAEGLLKQALALDQNDAAIWTFSSLFNSSIRTRGFDHAPVRREMARRDAERALKLAPDSRDALFALGRAQRDFEPEAAEQTFKQILARVPDDAGALGNLATIYDYAGRPDEAAALYERALAADPANPTHAALTRYTQFLLFFHYRRFTEAERCIRQSIAIQPSANSQGGLAMLLLTWPGDAAEAARVLTGELAASHNEPRTIWMTALTQLCLRAPDDVLRTVDRLADAYIQDNWFAGPKAYFAGRAHALAGRSEAARVAWESALALTEARLKTEPDKNQLHVMRGELLAFLGRTDDALREARTVEELSRRENLYWFTSPALIYAALGRADDALPLLEKLCNPAPDQNLGWPLTPALLRLDPLWDKLRDDPRFQKLCAEPAAPPALSPSNGLTEGAQLAAKALALITKVGFTRDDLAPAEDFARRATEKEPDSAAAWGVRAGIQSAWLFRNWDYSEKRRQDTQAFANRALALDPNEPEALLALGQMLRAQGAYDQAEALLRRAVAANPNHLRLARALAYTMSYLPGREAEALALQLEMLQRTPNDPLLRYETAMSYGNYGRGGAAPRNLAAGIEQLDAAIAIRPFSSALILKATLIGGWRGDLPAMRAVLDQADKLPIAERTEDRSVYIAMWAGLLEHRPDRVEAAAALTARNYMEDSVMPLHPKAWWLALAHGQAGKMNSARNDWSAAEAVLRQRIKDDPANLRYQVELATTLAWLDQRDEAARLVAVIEPAWRENLKFRENEALARYYAALGDAKRAVPYLAPVIDGSPFFSRKVIPLDPWWDKLRGQPEFEALLKEPAPKP